MYSTNTTRFLKMFNGTGQTKRLGSKAQSGDLVGGGGGAVWFAQVLNKESFKKFWKWQLNLRSWKT